jgi:ATP-dependent DNA ligase
MHPCISRSIPDRPQLARPGRSLPRTRAGLRAEADGFRAIVFCDGDEHFVQSRNGKLLDRYFPS